MKEEIVSEQESLQIIRQMIQTAKKEQVDDGKGWIVWGWLLFLASLFTYFNMQGQWFNIFFFWNLFGACTILLLGYGTVRHFMGKKNGRVRTYTMDLFEKLNAGFFISLTLIIVSMNTPLLRVDPRKGFALLLGLYGFWILIYGAVLSFRPSIIGAYITWMAAFVSLFITRFEYTMLLHAGAVLFGYIIPGHMAAREFNKQKKSGSRSV